MADDGDLRRDLLWRIEARRGSIQAFLRAHRPRTRRRATITVVLSSLAALFTAGPALGGEPFAQSVQDSLGLASDSYVWRTLCLLALLVSVAAAMLTNLGKAQDDVARLSSAEAANTELEGLSGLCSSATCPLEDGVKLYQQYIVKIPFVDDLARRRRRPAPPAVAGAVRAAAGAGPVRPAATDRRPVRAPAARARPVPPPPPGR